MAATDVIQEYLVSLGFQVDKPGFQELNKTINETTSLVQAATATWAKSFVAASGIIASALASVSTGMLGVAKHAANQDLQFQKLGRTMMVGKDAAWAMAKATDALGESLNDIAITPELLERYEKLIADGQNMKPGGDFEATMRGFRDLMFQFTRLKQEVSYAMTWVGYYIIKYLAGPLADVEKKFRSFNDSFVRNISVWTEKVARAAVYIINIFVHFGEMLASIGRHLKEMWNSFPKGVKIAVAAIGTLWAVIKASPLGRAIMLMSILLLLVDDYFGYFEGKDAALGKYWDKLHDFIQKAQTAITDFANEAEPVLETAWKWIKDGAQAAEDFAGKLADMGSRVTGSETFQKMADAAERLLTSLGSDLWDGVKETERILERIINACEKYGIVNQFKRAWDNLGETLSIVAGALSDVIDWCHEFWKDIDESEEMQDFIDAFGELVSVMADLINTIWELVNDALRYFGIGLGDASNSSHGFRDAIKLVVKVLAGMIRALSWIIKLMANLIKKMSNTKVFKSFWEEFGRVVRNFGELFDQVVEKVINGLGKIGRALLKLMKRDFKGAIAELFGGGGKGGKTTGLTEDELKYEDYIQKYSAMYGIDPNLARAVMKEESGFDPTVVSNQGAIGLMQVTPGAAQDAGVTGSLYDPETNIHAGVGYLAWIRDNYHPSSDQEWIQMYNAGPGNAGAADMPYVQRVLADRDDYASRTTYPSSGGTATGNSVVNTANSYDEGDKFINPELTDDASRSCASWASTVYSGAGVDGLWGASVDDLEAAFRQHNAWHGGDYDPQPGDYIQGVGGTEQTEGHAGIYLGNGKVRSRDSGGVKTWDLDAWKTAFGFDGYGSLAEYLQYSDAGGGGMGLVGRLPKQSLKDVLPALMEKLRDVDPTMVQSILQGGVGPGAPGNITIINKVDVGGVQVASTNASPDVIGQATADKTIGALQKRTNYAAAFSINAGSPYLT